MDVALQHHHDHYACSLPKKSGFLSSLILKSLFSDVYINPTQTAFLKSLSKKGIIVYASKYKSRFEYLFYHIRYKEEGVPFPEIGFEYRILLWQKISRLARIILAHLDHFFRFGTFPNPYESGFFKRQM
jgi:glycerol-3-phosphate O-acyltransferase